MKRIFAAIKIFPDENFLKLYYRLKSGLKHEKIKWVEPENIHITLKFFGETEETQINSIINVFNKATQDFKSFNPELENVGIFGSSYKPKVIWFGIKNNEQLIKLSNSVNENLIHIGYISDRQNFVPHLTVARIRFLNDKKLFQQIIDKNKTIKIQKIKVDKIYLLESILKREGPIYNVIEEFSLMK
jgi:2'-5' RNA ligase